MRSTPPAEAWKINRAADVTFGWRGWRPWVRIADKVEATQSLTAQYDAEAIRYLSYAFYPLSVGYAVYALVYREFTSYYSWALSSAVSFIYMFGFLNLCPQLYLNYKLQSVAHLPWRMLTYKFFGTIIDDLFAFIVKMPTLHRIAAFRDDIVFVVYLYQRWKYRVDMSRTNEFGLQPSGDREVMAAAATAAAVEADATPTSAGATSSSSGTPVAEATAAAHLTEVRKRGTTSAEST